MPNHHDSMVPAGSPRYSGYTEDSGDNVHIIASGENSTVVSTGVVDSIILGPGGSAALVYHDGERVRFAVAIEGENNIRAGVRYRLNEQHQFVEC